MVRLLYIIFFASVYCQAQKTDYAISQVPDSLKAGANAVVRLDQTDIVILSQKKMKIHTKRVVSVLNEKGQHAIDANENYDKTLSINHIEAIVYDGSGKEIKRFRKTDFKDQTATDGGTMFSDNRVLYLDYTPTQYPFTVAYQSEVTTSNTAFIPHWMPVTDYYVSVQQSIFNATYPDNLGFRKKETNFRKFKIEKTADTATNLSYQAINIPAQKPELYSPSLTRIFPRLMLGLDWFNLEGVDGNAKTWKEFGKWYSEALLSGTTEIPDDTKAKIKALVGDEKDPIKKARIVYKFVQERSRYVSIQVGIGGFRPMPAKDVDRLGYGDCKALSNYTKALLEVVGVPSYNTILYGDRNKRDIDRDFVSVQGNHMILSVPDGNHYIWLECTSQDAPFGYHANFTDDREVLVVKPDGGEIVRTELYPDKKNTQISKGYYAVAENGTLSGKIIIVSEGTQYSQKAQVEKMLPDEKEAYYKDYWANINNLKINKTAFSNDKEKISFSENLEIEAAGYGAQTGNIMMFALNAFNQSATVLPRYRTRNNPIEIERGFLDQDEIEITLPENYIIDARPNDLEIKDKFGEYKTELTLLNENKLRYRRTFLLNKGQYEKTDYENYRKFREQIAKADNAKIVLTRKP